MLVLTRKHGESILIGDSIRVTIIRHGDSMVSVGIDAPKEIKILRAELRERPDADDIVRG